MTKKIKHIFENDIEKKKCCTCKLFYELNNFNKSKTTWDQLRPRCKTCLKLERIKKKIK